MAKPAKTIRERIQQQQNAEKRAASASQDAADQHSLAGSTPKVETYTAADLMRMELPEPRWAVGDIVPEGLNILAGKPKMGKSWLALNVAIAVSMGGVALGNIRVEVGEVLYLALEDNTRRLKTRLEKLLQRQDAAPPIGLTFTHRWPSQDKGGLAEIAHWLDARQCARLVIIDTWAKFKPSRARSGNEYEQDYREAGELKALADHYGVAVLVLHHCRKMGSADPLEEVSGTLGLTGACDGVLVLRRERGRHAAALHITGRDIEEQELALSFDVEHCLWSIVGKAEEYRLSKERAEVVELFQREGRPLSIAEGAGLLGIKGNTAKQRFHQMAKAGQLKALGDGLYDLPANHANRDNPGNDADATNQDGNGPVSGRSESGNQGESVQTPWD